MKLKRPTISQIIFGLSALVCVLLLPLSHLLIDKVFDHSSASFYILAVGPFVALFLINLVITLVDKLCQK